MSHYVLDGGKLVVAHAGLTEAYQGRASGRVRSFALYGETTGETDEYGLPVRIRGPTTIAGSATVVYGHTPMPDAGVGQQHHLPGHRMRVRRQLTALRYPEREMVSVPAQRVWYEPVRPLTPEEPVRGRRRSSTSPT